MARLGTTVVPWNTVEDRLTVSGTNGTELKLLPGAHQIPEVSIAMGLTETTYAFTRASTISNLYRVRLP
jgi:hypothetical protein